LSLSDHWLHAYRRSQYAAAGIQFRIGRRSAALDGLLAGMGTRRAVLITAWNPRSRIMPPAWNTRMMARLTGALRGHSVLPGSSGAGRHFEHQLLAAVPTRWAGHLGRRFRQNAIVDLRAGQKPRLLALV
jgi:hypothetical protein